MNESNNDIRLKRIVFRLKTNFDFTKIAVLLANQGAVYKIGNDVVSVLLMH